MSRKPKPSVAENPQGGTAQQELPVQHAGALDALSEVRQVVPGEISGDLGAETAPSYGRSPAQEMFLPVSGYVRLSAEEMAVIDHPGFQRLRRVRQLGLAHFVFPGGTHTRFEHSVGAVHASQRILESIRGNGRSEKGLDSRSSWQRSDLPAEVEPFVRLGALLHDVGHLPFGHTLEDELNHLNKHDATERLELVSRKAFPAYAPAVERVVAQRPIEGWTLETLIDNLYAPHVRKLGIEVAPFDVVKAIIGKAPKVGKPERKAWEDQVAPVASKIPLQACRDIVGDTICADFLDYLFRDWHHLGKPMFEDTRLYQYMEVREHAEQGKRFVINAGRDDRIRHDAFTNILELLEARYKLAETVLFHRTKLAIIGLFDRCLLEIGDIYKGVGITQEEFRQDLEAQLLETPDDGIFDLLMKLSADDESAPETIREALKQEDALLTELPSEGPSLIKDLSKATGPLRTRLKEVQCLIEHFRSRHVYTLIHKVRMNELASPQTPDNDVVKGMVKLYRSPQNRLHFLRGLEAICELPPGSVVMYCPPDAQMNAKVAEVKLLIGDDVQPFNEYEAMHGPEGGLTHGALTAQIGRFHQLWSAQVFIDPTVIAAWSENQRTHLRHVVKDCFSIWPEDGRAVARTRTDGSLAVVLERQAVAARSGTPRNDDASAFVSFEFPGGLPFAKKD